MAKPKAVPTGAPKKRPARRVVGVKEQPSAQEPIQETPQPSSTSGDELRNGLEELKERMKAMKAVFTPCTSTPKEQVLAALNGLGYSEIYAVLDEVRIKIQRDQEDAIRQLRLDLSKLENQRLY
jgi:hypothetical protein